MGRWESNVGPAILPAENFSDRDSRDVLLLCSVLAPAGIHNLALQNATPALNGNECANRHRIRQNEREPIFRDIEQAARCDQRVGTAPDCDAHGKARANSTFPAPIIVFLRDAIGFPDQN